MAEQIITIKNDSLIVTISTIGAGLQSITGADGREYLWNGQQDVWAGRAPVLFPVCGGVRGGVYRYEGQEYKMEKHGYLRHLEFSLCEYAKNEACFLSVSNEETKKVYPFDYEVRIRYTLDGESVKVEYRVKNTGSGEMYYSIGAHEGYSVPEGIEEYEIAFECDEPLESTVLAGDILSRHRIEVPSAGGVLPLKYEYFAVDALVFKNLKSRSATLRKKDGSRSVRVDFAGSDYFLLWTKPNAKFICLEPWCGISDDTESDGDITKKEGIIRLTAGEIRRTAHTITIG